MQPLKVICSPKLANGELYERSEERHANLVRFQSELEFIQCLANPQYLHELYVQKYLDDPAFLEYLKYLEYWRKPEYVRFIIYPTSLVYLTLLLTPAFRARLGDMAFVADLMRIGTRHHETWRAEKEPERTGETKAEGEEPKEENEDENEKAEPATAP